VLNGTVTYSMSYDAATGVTTTTASAPTITLGVTQAAASGNVTGTITITSLAYSRIHGTDPTSDTVSTSGSISVEASNAVISFDVATPTAVVVSDGNVEGGEIQLSSDNTVETITPAGTSSVNISVTSNGKTGTYTETVGSLRELIGGWGYSVGESAPRVGSLLFVLMALAFPCVLIGLFALPLFCLPAVLAFPCFLGGLLALPLFCLPAVLAFPCFLSGLLALPLCGETGQFAIVSYSSFRVWNQQLKFVVGRVSSR
jgi:hypothetical protein